MTKVMVDDAIRAKLNGLNGQIEFCDRSGESLGHFLPNNLYKELLAAWAKVHITDEEVQRARQQTGGRPLAEIWKSLGRT
jgi:hypothetical protein